MANSVQKNSAGPVKLTIKTDGTELAGNIQVLSVHVNHCINRIPTATLVVADGNVSKKAFTISDLKTFEPGNKIDISAGYGSKEQSIFSGIIVRHGIGINVDNSNNSQLKVVCSDSAQMMTMTRNNANYLKQKDSDIMSSLISGHSGLSADVTATSTEYDELVQFNSSDWDFLLTRAEVNGYLVNVVAGKVTVAPPKAETPQLTATWGDDLISFEADMDARYQYKKVSASCWDMAKQAPLNATAAGEAINKQGNITSADLSKALGGGDFLLQSNTNLLKPALTDWAKAQQVKSELARIRGKMRFIGNAAAVPGGAIKVAGVGQRFEGNVFISQVEHEISNGHWISNVDFGMSPHWSAEYRDLAAPPASGLLPGVEGLQVGQVMKLDGDPLKQFRIQVKVPVLQAKKAGVWARLSSPYASSGFGHFFIPEVGDEVILGYFNNNPSDPVVLGCLYSSTRKPPPPGELTADNDIKAFVTKSMLTIKFDDKDKIITVVTPKGNTLVLDDKEEQISMTDSNKNKVVMSKSGIELNSVKDVTISAKENISLSATKSVTIKGSTGVTVSGSSVSLKADTSFTAQGSSGATVKSSGVTQIQGTMVKIN
ncbi:MAG: Rhs element Vgr protein [Phenylobacterium sp.]|jgi:Rhs element Vgr protein